MLMPKMPTKPISTEDSCVLFDLPPMPTLDKRPRAALPPAVPWTIVCKVPSRENV